MARNELEEFSTEFISGFVPEALLVCDGEQRIIYWNPKAEEMLGYHPSEIVGRPFSGLKKAKAEYLVKLRSKEALEYSNVELLHQNGSVVPACLKLAPLKGPDGPSQVVVVSIRPLNLLPELTARQAAEERFRVAVEAAPCGMMMVDNMGRIAMVNTQVERLFGFQRNELLGNEIEMLIPARFRSSHCGKRQSYFAQPLNRPMGAGRDLFGLRKDGTELPIEIGLNPIKTNEGEFVLASVIDISERVQTTEHLKNSLREKEVLLTEIHHRVKNNLTVVGSLLYLQSTTTDNEKVKSLLQDCQDRIRSMAMVHEQLYHSGDLSVVDFADYIRELVNRLLRNKTPASRKVTIDFELESCPLELSQAIPCGLILNELLSNSLKHGSPAGRELVIRVSLSNQASRCLLLRVADNGIGLPPEEVLRESRSIGIKLVRSLARQLNAEFKLLRKSPGTEGRIEINKC